MENSGSSDSQLRGGTGDGQPAAEGALQHNFAPQPSFYGGMGNQPHGGGGGFVSGPCAPMVPGLASSEAMQAFAAAAAANNLGLFCTAPGASPFPGHPSATAFSPQLAAAVAGYGPAGPRSMAHHQQQQPGNRCSPALIRRNGGSTLGPTASASSATSASGGPSSSSINRSQRCGVCRGCQCKPCGQCTYCQDSPQFGGPGVKKQSCIERRCLRVLENRLQRDAPSFKARIGCNVCEDCQSSDCQICLVCLDKRFFNSKYMAGALCAKKRCNNATSLELPMAAGDRTMLKRHSEGSSSFQQFSKRQMLVPAHSAQLNSNIARILSAANEGGQCRGGVFSPTAEGTHSKYSIGRSSVGGNSTSSTNSPLSETGGGGLNHSSSGQSDTPPAMAHLAQPMLLGGLPRWTSGPSSQMLVLPPGAGQLGPYPSFDQMASLAAVAAVGLPQQQHVPPPYPAAMYAPKGFLSYPKYEYFSEEGPTVAANVVNCPGGTEGMPAAGDGKTASQTGEKSGDSLRDNLLVPPSYSDVQKVVLQPL